MIGIVIACLIILLIIGLFSVDNSTNEMIISYLNSYGITVEKKPVQISHLTIPNTFDKIYESYNAIQAEAGFNLENYKGKAVIKYTYRIINSEPEALVNVFLYSNEIIAADISRQGSEGFVKPIVSQKN